MTDLISPLPPLRYADLPAITLVRISEHILIMLEQLPVEEEPSAWFEAWHGTVTAHLRTRPVAEFKPLLDRVLEAWTPPLRGGAPALAWEDLTALQSALVVLSPETPTP